MVKQVEVFYEGWGERWHWGTLVEMPAATGNRPQIGFQYSAEALQRGFELSAYKLPLHIGQRLHTGFPLHQMELPGPVYDALPDGWGMLLMDRLFKRRNLNPARIGPLERLTFIGNNAMGALTFVPAATEGLPTEEDISIGQLAADVEVVALGEGSELLERLMRAGGSPQGARPKAQVYRDPASDTFSTVPSPGAEAWLVKFPANREHPEVCAVEFAYAECLRRCDIPTPDTRHFLLPGGKAAFASRRFDRRGGMRIPMHSLAAYVEADYRTPGSLDYTGFLRATAHITRDNREKAGAFARAVFNVAFNNRDDHPKNFSYTMSRDGQWALSPAYDVTFCEGPGSYHQMDVMGQALDITRADLLRLANAETDLDAAAASRIIDRTCQVALQFSAIATELLPSHIAPDTLSWIQARINANVQRLTAPPSPTRGRG